MIRHVQRDDIGAFGDAGIAGGRVELRQPWRLGQFPRKRVFTPARADEKDIHAKRFLSFRAASMGQDARRHLDDTARQRKLDQVVHNRKDRKDEAGIDRDIGQLPLLAQGAGISVEA